MAEKIGVALIGCGGFSKSVQQALEDVGRYRVAACYDVDTQAADEAAARFDAARCESPDAAIDTSGVEAVVLVTPNPTHREQAEKAFAAGRHVFVEKPIANTVADGLAMCRAAERAERVFMVGHMTRRGTAFRRVAEAARTGRLGQIVSAEAHFSHGGGKRLGPDAWRARAELCPGLPLNVIGVHLVDIVNLALGRPRRVAAMHRRAIVPGNDDVTATLVAYDEPAVATVMSHYCTPGIHELRVTGTEGIAESHRFGRQFVLTSEGSEPVVEELQHTRGPMNEEFAEFAAAIREGGPVETGGREAVDVVAVVEASARSAAEGRFVDVDELFREAETA